MRLFFILILLSTSGFASITFDIEAKNIRMSENVKLSTLNKSDLNHNAIFIIDKNIQELQKTDRWKGEKLNKEVLFNFKTYHKRIRLNNDKAVEEFNKMYISIAGDRDLISIKARSINPDGTLTDFDDNNIKYIEDFEGHGPMKIFAFEGVQVGAEIEYLYTIQEFDEDNYGHIYVQNDYPKKDYSYQLIFPSRLIFSTKSYNGAPNMKLDTINEKKHRLIVKSTPIDFFEAEESSAGDANLQRIEYVLSKNTSTEKENFYDWNNAKKQYTENTYSYASNPKLEKKEHKALLKLIQLMGLEKITDEKQKLFTIENYIKTNFNIGTEYRTTLVHEILNSKTCSFYGATRLYVLLLTHLNINHEYVLTCDRFEKEFDGNFETFNFLNKTLVYFPQHAAFTDPSRDNYRFGIIPSDYAYHKGLFITKKEKDGVNEFISEVKEIPGLPCELSYSNMEAKVNITPEFDNCLINLKIESLGYNDIYPRPYLSYLNAEKKDEVLKNELKIVKDQTEVIDYTTQNETMSGHMLNNPFIVEGNVKIESLLEKAGPNYLLKVGLIIGPQMEMYQNKKRKNPGVLQYKHGYKRVIHVRIPDGYKVSNLNDLTMDVFYLDSNKRSMEFTSKFELKDNILSINVNEFYDEINVPVERYEEYRAVINAAADFNKKTLVLQKK